jgi:hypothetical protein
VIVMCQLNSLFLFQFQLICKCNLNPAVHQPFVFKITFNGFLYAFVSGFSCPLT